MSSGTPFRTYAYRNFRRELSSLSRIHWYYNFSASRVVEEIGNSTKSGDVIITSALPAGKFPKKRLWISQEQYVAEAADHIAHLRLLLLIKACACTEDFLHRYVCYWAVVNGYEGNKSNCLSCTGKALVAPAMVSNIAKVATYIEKLFKIDLGESRGALGPAYSIRCAAAHNGGIADHETDKSLKFMKLRVGDCIRLTWDHLHSYLKSLDDVCTRVELHVPESQRRRAEIKWLVQDIVDQDPTVDATRAKKALVDDYAYQRLPSKRQIANWCDLRNS